MTKIIPRRAFAMVEAAAKLDATIVIAQAEIAIKLIAMTVSARAEIALIPAMMSIVDVRLVKMDNARIFPLMTANAVASEEFAKMESVLVTSSRTFLWVHNPFQIIVILDKSGFTWILKVRLGCLV